MEEETNQQIDHIKNAIEALLFVNERPITLEQFKNALETIESSDIKQMLGDLTSEYEGNERGMKIVEIAGGWQMLSNPQYASYVRRFYKTRHKERLSKPALETMAIIAYKQPITRGEVEVIRGVNSDGVIAHLQNKELIKVVGRRDVQGKPFLYGSTKLFLEYFGLKSIDDLPKIEELEILMAKKEDETFADNEESNEEKIPEEAIHTNDLEKAKQNAVNNQNGEPSSDIREAEKVAVQAENGEGIQIKESEHEPEGTTRKD